MKNKHIKNYIFIGGKNLGVKSLEFMIKKKIYPKIVIPNKDDLGKDNVFNKSIKKFAREKKIKITSIKNLSKLIKKRKITKPDIIFCIGSTQILPKNILKFSQKGIVNIHPSLLPKYRGRYSLVHAIFNGEKNTGATAHFLSNKIDTGKLILKKKFKIDHSDTAKDLYEKFTKTGFLIFKVIANRWIKDKKIKSYIYKGKIPSYINKNLPNSGILNWNWNTKQIYNFLRAVMHEPFLPPAIYIGKNKYYLCKEDQIKKEKFLKSPL